MAWISPVTEEVGDKFEELLFEKRKWWQLKVPIWSALGHAVLKAGRNHPTAVQPLLSSSNEIIFGIIICESDELFLVENDNLPDIVPSPEYSEKLPLLLRIALTYADILAEIFTGTIYEEPEMPSELYKLLYKVEDD